MKKILLRIFLYAFLILGIYKAYGIYNNYKEDQRRSVYYENLVDTSSPTVSVLRDSILIGYQNEKRTIHIYVPPDYAIDTLANFPVIYMLDGESSFNDLENMGPEWQINEVINDAHANNQQTAIVVAINEAENRDAEYTPFVNDDNPDAHGAKFANWVATDLKNLIDSNFRTKKESTATTIGGISRSGMMAYYMMMAHPDVFGNAFIQSPAMWVDYDKLMEMNLSEKQLSDNKIFISVGEYEGGIMVPHAKDIYAKFKKQGLTEKQLHIEIIPDEAHWHITWRKSFALGYPWLMGY